MPRLLVLDIDGTLLDPSDVVTPVVHDAIAEARHRGTEVALATGRRLKTTRPIVERLGIQVPLVVYNGALVWSTREESVLNQIAFSPEALELAVRQTVSYGLSPVLLQGPPSVERIVIADDPPPVPYIDAFIRPRLHEVQRLPLSELLQLPDVLTVDAFGPEAQLRALTSHLASLGLAVFHAGPLDWESDLPHWAANMHMPGVSKAHGVELLAADLGLTLADVVAVGDGENDLPLLQAAGTGVAMGNAPAHVRAIADAVVRGHDEDGVAEAIQRFVLGG